VPVSRFAQCENKGWEADERPEPRSLGLLPSGPDPVGEWLVHRQPPGDYIGRGGGESKHRRAFACGQWTHTVECPLGSIFWMLEMRYAVVIEKAEGNYSAYVPDLPGCVAAGARISEVEGEIRDAIRFHVDGLKADGLAVPAPTSIAEYVEA